MGSFFQRKGVRRFFLVFKWVRVAVLLVILFAVATVAYLQTVGLPDLLKNPLLSALRQRGVEAQFVSARLSWGPSILIENAFFRSTNETAGPSLSAEWTRLNLNRAAALRARLRVDSFEVRQAALSLPVASTNQAPLSLKDVSLRVTLDTNSLAVLHDCSGWFHGIQLHVNGQIRAFHDLRDWKLPPRFTAAAPGTNQAGAAATNAFRFTAWDLFQKIHFKDTPELSVNFSADGRNQNSLRADLEFTAAGAQTPWGKVGPLRFRAVGAHLFGSHDEPILQTRLRLRDIATPWANGRFLTASIDFSRDAGTNFYAVARLEGQGIATAWNSPSGSNWVRVGDVRWDGVTSLLSPTFQPAKFQGTLRASNTESGWGSVGAASLVLQIRREESSPVDDPAWGPWSNATPFSLDWQASATNILTAKLKLDRADFKGGWHAPRLAIDTLDAFMYRGHLKVGGTLDVATRETQAKASIDFDPRQISHLLTGPAQKWMSLYDWKTPPSLSASLRFVLPPWTNRLGAWSQEAQDSLQLAGHFAVQQGAFRGIAVQSAEAGFNYTNHVWNVSGLRLAGDGGWLNLDYSWSERAHDYHFRFDSKWDPAVALPLLTEPQKRVLREWNFSDKPELKGEVWGNWVTPETTGITAALSTGQFTVRGEKMNQLNAQLDYTNHFLRISELKLAHESGQVTVPLAGIDFASNLISLSNGVSTIDPEPVRRALGNVAPPFMKDVHFDSQPLIQASGVFRPGNDDFTDMHFSVKGSRFRWDRIRADSVEGTVDYHVRTVVVTNVSAGFYKTGKARGWIVFDWDPKLGTKFDSDFGLTNLDLAAVARDVDKNSKLEGRLDGHLHLGSPYDAQETNFFGNGWLHVYDGLLWDIRLFGMLSPVLNAIAPGAGNSRAHEARASFIITNGVLDTGDLEIRSSGFRLLYHGTLDGKTRLNARVEAKLLRDTPVFGHFFSWMLIPLDKLFEYRVTGTIKEPVAEPLYVPKVLTEILRPFHTLKKTLLSPPSGNSNSTPKPKLKPVPPSSSQ